MFLFFRKREKQPKLMKIFFRSVKALKKGDFVYLLYKEIKIVFFMTIIISRHYILFIIIIINIITDHSRWQRFV